MKELAERGFYPDTSDGGTTTLHYRASTDSYYWILRSDRDATMPRTLTEPVWVGYYWNEPFKFRRFAFDTLQDAVEWIEQHPTGVPRVHSTDIENPYGFVVPGAVHDDPGVAL